MVSILEEDEKGTRMAKKAVMAARMALRFIRNAYMQISQSDFQMSSKLIEFSEDSIQEKAPPLGSIHHGGDE